MFIQAQVNILKINFNAQTLRLIDSNEGSDVRIINSKKIYIKAQFMVKLGMNQYNELYVIFRRLLWSLGTISEIIIYCLFLINCICFSKYFSTLSVL